MNAIRHDFSRHDKCPEWKGFRCIDVFCKKKRNIFSVWREHVPVAFVDKRAKFRSYAFWKVLLTGDVFYTFLYYKIYRHFNIYPVVSLPMSAECHRF